VVPGYPGRTGHITVTGNLGGNVLHTGQLYLPDTVTDAVYRKAPYSARQNRTPRNAGDAIYRNGGKRSAVTWGRNEAGLYVATIVMRVSRL